MSKKILLIEDNEAVRENTAEILDLAGYNVITAENGRIGVELAQQHHPDLIVCDIMMPELDGYGVLHLLSRNPETASTPFIFLTAKAERSDLRKGMELGADDYITKPFDDVELLNAIERRLKKNEFLRDIFGNTAEGLNSFITQARGLTELEELSSIVRLRSYKKRETIYREGDIPNRLFFIEQGKVKACKADENGKEMITGLFSTGDYFGYTSLLENCEYNDSAEALEACEIREIPRQEFEALIFKNADVARKFIQMLANDVSEKEQQLLNLAYSSVRKRVADALLQLRSHYEPNAAIPSAMKIKREDLANLVGTATESVVRTLSDFRQEGIIDIATSGITILDEKTLEQMRW